MPYKKVCGVYRIVNLVNNKIYVGSSISSLKQRWVKHKCELRHNKHNNSYLQRAWNKYGEESFVFFVIEECSEDIVIAREDYWINLYNSKNRANGYNLISADHHFVSDETRTKIGIGNRGKKMSEDAKQKISSSSMNKKKSDSHRANISKARQGMIFTEEHKKNISKGCLGRKFSEVTKQKLSCNKIGNRNHFYGKHHSAESKKKISMAGKGRKRSLESIQRGIETRKNNYNKTNHIFS